VESFPVSAWPRFLAANRTHFAEKRSYMTRVSSPCIRVCTLDSETGLCEGCGRTREEITRWYRMTEEERQLIMAGLPERMRQAFALELPSTPEENKAE
jgi:predicted Fe-S protein YdhL (DUF1289 family)